MGIISESWLKKMLDQCRNRFDNGDDFESTQREAILEAYYGYESELKDERGRSTVVSRDFLNTVESLMPQLMKPFVARNDSFFNLAATSEETEQAAENAKEAIRYILRKNGEYKIFHTWIKNALIYSLGVVKFYVDHAPQTVTDAYEDLTEEELHELLYVVNQDGELSARPDITIVGEVIEKEEGLFDVEIQKIIEGSPEIKIQALPPEEFLYPGASESIHDSPIIAHSHYLPDYELLQRGFDPDIVTRHASNRIESTEQQERERKSALGANDQALGLEGKFVKVTEAYIRSEDSGEMRQVIALGDTLDIVKDSAWPYRVPFAVLTPFMMPNTINGIGIWELIADIQNTKTKLIRQGLDNHEKVNDVRIIVTNGNIDLDDLVNSKAGQIIQADSPNDITPLQVQPVSSSVLTWLQAMDELKEDRVGISKAMAGMDPNALAGVSNIVAAQMVKSGTDKIEYIARNFAETGMQDLVLGLLEIIHAAHPEGLKFHGTQEYVNYIPNDDDIFDYEIVVGLGTVGEEQNIAQLTMIAEQQYNFISELGPQNPTVPFTKYVATLHEILKASGYKNPDKYFDLQGAAAVQMTPPAEEKEDPLVEAQVVASQAEIDIAQSRLQIETQEVLAKLQIEQEKLTIQRLELELKNKEIDRKIAADANKNEIEEDKVKIEKSKND